MTDSSGSKSRTPANWRHFIPPSLAALLVAMLGVALLSPARKAIDGGPLVGKPAPTFALNTLDGSLINLVSLKGRPVVLNFWASWCQPCRKEAPLFRELSTRQTAGMGLAVIGIMFEETSETDARNFIREYELTYPNLLDPGVKTAINYGVSGVPTTVFIDSTGVIQQIVGGELNREQLNIGLEKIGVEGIGLFGMTGIE